MIFKARRATVTGERQNVMLMCRLRLALFAVPILLALLGGVFGCASMRVGSQSAPGVDISSYRSYSWLHAVQPTTGIPRLDRPLLHQIVRDEIDRRLAAKGIRWAGDGIPDLLVSYHVAIQKKAEASRLKLGDSYTRAWGKEQWSGTPMGASGTYVKEFEEGTLILEIIDARTSELIWRGFAHAVLDASGRTRSRTATVRTAVRRIIRRLPR